MLGTELREGETLELKSEWNDDALKDLAAFANTRGGTLIIASRDCQNRSSTPTPPNFACASSKTPTPPNACAKWD